MATPTPILPTVGTASPGWMGDIFGNKIILVGIIVIAVVIIICLLWWAKKWPFSKKVTIVRRISPDMSPMGVTADDGIGPKPEDALMAFIINGFLGLTNSQLKPEPSDIEIKSYDFPETTGDNEPEVTCDFLLKGLKKDGASSKFTVIGDAKLSIFKLLKIRDEATYKILLPYLTAPGQGLVSQEFTE